MDNLAPSVHPLRALPASVIDHLAVVLPNSLLTLHVYSRLLAFLILKYIEVREDAVCRSLKKTP